MPRAAVCLALVAITLRAPAGAISIAQLDARDWHVKRLRIEGNLAFSDATLRDEMVTPVRPWYTPWRGRPVFEPGSFEQDLVRLRRFYEAHGFFEARVTYDIATEALGAGDLLDVTIHVEENQPVTVASVDVDVEAPAALPLPDTLAVRSGSRFDEAAYRKAETELKAFFVERSYAHVEVRRAATVDLARHTAAIRYTVVPGPEVVFGDTRIEGTKTVDPEVVRRDLEWEAGEPFKFSKVQHSRENLVKTDLFASVRIGWESEGKPPVAPMRVEVTEKPWHEIRAGLGYATDEKFRVQLRWDDHNFYGGGREMAVALKYSSINASFQTLLTQPHFLWQHANGVVEARFDRDDEDNYVLEAARLFPRIERRFTPTLAGSLGVRVEADRLTSVDRSTVVAIGAVKRDLTLTGPSAGLVWNTTDSPYDPHRGGVLALNGDAAGLGDFRFWKARVEGKKYTQLPADLVLANRLQIAFADSIGGVENLPLWERLYAGGERSVRGYGRRRLGPRDGANQPIGGLSSVEGSIELRRPIWNGIAGAVFFDFGQVTTRRLHPPFDDLKFGTGFGVSYATPVGPLRIDLGFPLERPRDDAAVQVYFSIGQFF